MFHLDKEEVIFFSRSQIATLKRGSGRNIKYAPLVFTEQGIAMLSSVLNSDRAIQVNFKEVFRIIRLLIKQDETPKHKMGFHLTQDGI